MASAGALGAINILLGLDTKQFQDGLTKAEYQSQGFSRQFSAQMRQINRSARELTRTIDNVRASAARLTGVFAGAFGAAEIIRAADSYGQMASRLKAATRDADEFRQVQDQLYEVSNRTYKSFDDAAELFVRVRGAMRQLGLDAKKTADFVSTIQFGLTLDSASPEKTKSVIDALSKSLLQGKLSMEALNTVVGASPTLFQALADTIAGGSQQALRQMVADGKVGARELTRLSERMKELGAGADNMATSVGDAFVKLRNNFTRLIGDADASTGATAKLVTIIDFAADHVKELAEAVALFGAFKGIRFLTSTFADIGRQFRGALNIAKTQRQQIQNTLELAQKEKIAAQAAAASARSIDEKTIAVARLKAATQELDAAQKAALRSAKGLSAFAKGGRFLGALVGGIPGAIALGVTAAAGAFINYTQNAKEAEQANNRLTQSTEEYRKSLLALTKTQLDNELNNARDQREEIYKELTKTGFKSIGSNFLEFFQYSIPAQSIAMQMREIAKESIAAQEPVQEFDRKIRALINTVEGNGTISRNVREEATKLGAELIESYQKYQKLDDQVRVATGSMENLTDAMSAQAAAMREASAEAQKYIDDLRTRLETANMLPSQKYAYDVERKGGNEEQVEQAKFLGELEQKNKDLATAVQEGNAKQIDAIRQSIIALVEQRNEMRLNAIQAEETAQANIRAAKAAAMALYAGSTTMQAALQPYTEAMQQNDEQSKRLRAQMAEARSQYREDLKLAEDLIKRTTTNVQARPTRARSSAGRSGASRAAREQESELQRLVKQLKEEQDQLGMTRLEQQYYSIAKMKGAESLKAEARQIAQNISIRKEQMETEKQARLLQQDLASFADKDAIDIVTAGIGSKTRDYLQREIDVQQEFNQKLRELQEAQESDMTRISDEAYAARLQALTQSEQAKLDIIRENQRAREELERDWATAAKEAITNYVDSAINAGQQIQSLVTNSINSIESAFTDFVTTGKANFKDMIDSMIKDLMRFAVRYAVIAPIFDGIKQGLGAMGLGGLLPRTVGYATGGYIRGPGTGTSDSILARLSNGEAVLTAREIRQIGGPVGFSQLRKAIAAYGAQTPNVIAARRRDGIPAFANGGIVGQAMSVPAQPSGQTGSMSVEIVNNSSQPIQARRASFDAKNSIVQVVVEDIHRNGPIKRAFMGVA